MFGAELYEIDNVHRTIILLIVGSALCINNTKLLALILLIPHIDSNYIITMFNCISILVLSALVYCYVIYLKTTKMLANYEHIYKCKLLFVYDEDEINTSKYYLVKHLFKDHFLEIDDYKHMRNIVEKLHDTNKSIHFIVEVNGGNVDANNNMLHYLNNFKNNTHAFVPRYAKSAGTLFTLACKEIYMTDYACLSATDPQFTIDDDQYSSRAIIDTVKRDKLCDLEKFQMKYHDAKIENAHNINITRNYIKSHVNGKKYAGLVERMTNGMYNHGLPIDKETLRNHIKVNDINKHSIMPVYKHITKILYDKYFF